jgi:hypothetical protein
MLQILCFLTYIVRANIYAWDIHRTDTVTCTDYKQPIPECIHTDFSRNHIKPGMNLTIKIWTKEADEPIPTVHIVTPKGNFTQKIEPVVLLTRVPFEVVIRIPDVVPDRYEIRLNGFGVGVPIIVDPKTTVYPMKSGTLPNSDSRTDNYLWLIGAGSVVLIGVGYFVYTRKPGRKGEHHVELLEQYYDDEFESSPRPQ